MFPLVLCCTLCMLVRTSSERSSYRAPRAPSRYLQAAEAYGNRNKSNNNNSTWSGGRARWDQLGVVVCNVCVLSTHADLIDTVSSV